MNSSILLSHRLLVLAVAAVFLAGSFAAPFQILEHGAYALATRVLPAADVSRAVAVVGIDRAALAGIGAWPWPRDRIAATLDRLRVLGARTIGVVLPLEGAETPPALAALVAEAKRSRRGLSGSLKKWAAALDTDRELARALTAHGRVVLAARFAPPPGAAPAAAPSAGPWNMKLAQAGLLTRLAGPATTGAVTVHAPLEELARQSAAVGLVPDARVWQAPIGVPLAVTTGERAAPGVVTALAAVAAGGTVRDTEVVPGRGVRIGKRLVDAPDLVLYPLALSAPGDAARVPEFSVAELWRPGRVERALRGKTVLLGFTDASLTPLLRVPGGQVVAPVTWLAHGLGSLLEDSRVSMPAWFHAAQRLLVVALAAMLLLVPLRWHGRGGAILTLATALLMLNAELVALLTRQLWLPLALPASFLLAAQTVLCIRRAFAAWAGRRLDEVAVARRELGMSLKGQGRLDDAFAEYRKSPPRTGILEPLYELGLAFESRRQFAKAAAVYAHADAIRPAFRDVRDRLARLKKVQAGIQLAPVGGGAGNRTVILNDSSIENPTLAHYRLERELGRGAMAVVYLATDEKLGRKVAVKALALTEEFEGEALEEAQARFRREAEAAARLNHPNIVTIFEAGEDHDLAYIAMDYVEGESLEDATDADDLLSVWEVLEIGIQVADALDYAHEKQVVHRDVKPSNIIYDVETGTVKVTDFGIACLTDASRTRTGTVLGTPSYMSPEQAAGKKLDGRSDLFSLGVTLYQLLTGRLPFVGDSLANLIYRITTEKHPSLKTIRPDLNASISRVINKVLQKDPDDRFETGAELAEALLRCQEKQKRGRRARGRNQA